MYVGARRGKMVLEIGPYGALIGTITNSADFDSLNRTNQTRKKVFVHFY